MKPVTALPNTLATVVAPDPVSVVERLAAIDRNVTVLDLQLLLIEQRLSAIGQNLPAQAASSGARFAPLGGWFAALGARAQTRPMASTGPAVSPLA